MMKRNYGFLFIYLSKAAECTIYLRNLKRLPFLLVVTIVLILSYAQPVVADECDMDNILKKYSKELAQIDSSESAINFVLNNLMPAYAASQNAENIISGLFNSSWETERMGGSKKDAFLERLEGHMEILGKTLSVANILWLEWQALQGDDAAKLQMVAEMTKYQMDMGIGAIGGRGVTIALIGVFFIDYALNSFIQQAFSLNKEYWWDIYVNYMEDRYPHIVKGRDSWVNLIIREGGKGVRRRLEEFWDDPWVWQGVYGQGKTLSISKPASAEKYKREFAAEYYRRYLHPTIQTFFRKQAERAYHETLARAENECHQIKRLIAELKKAHDSYDNKSAESNEELLKSHQDERVESQETVNKGFVIQNSSNQDYCDMLWRQVNSYLENYDLLGAKAVLEDAYLHGCDFPFEQLNARINQLDYCMGVNQYIADALFAGDAPAAQKALRDARAANCNLDYQTYEKQLNDLLAHGQYCDELWDSFLGAAKNQDVSSMHRIISQARSSGCQLSYEDMEQLVSQVEQNIEASRDNARMMAALSSFMNAMGQVMEQAQQDTRTSSFDSTSGCGCPRTNEPFKVIRIDTNNNPNDATYLYCKYDKLGTLSYECPLVNNKKHGLVRSYHYGTLKIADEATYKNGVIDGFRRTYYKDGTLSAEWRYENGNLISLRRYRRDGSLSDECFYRNNHMILQKGYDKHGRVTRVWKKKNGR